MRSQQRPGANDLGPNADGLPGYYGLSEEPDTTGRKPEIDYKWLAGYFDPRLDDDGKGGKQKTVFLPDIPVSRWIDGVLEDKQNFSQRDSIFAVIFWGHVPNSLADWR